jgi:hypothetical protein
MIVWSQILNNVAARCPCIRCFRSSYGQVLAGVVLRIAPDWPHHADAVGFDGRVSTSIDPNLRVIFDEIPIRSCSRR